MDWGSKCSFYCLSSMWFILGSETNVGVNCVDKRLLQVRVQTVHVTVFSAVQSPDGKLKCTHNRLLDERGVTGSTCCTQEEYAALPKTTVPWLAQVIHYTDQYWKRISLCCVFPKPPASCGKWITGYFNRIHLNTGRVVVLLPSASVSLTQKKKLCYFTSSLIKKKLATMIRVIKNIPLESTLLRTISKKQCYFMT